MRRLKTIAFELNRNAVNIERQNKVNQRLAVTLSGKFLIGEIRT